MKKVGRFKRKRRKEGRGRWRAFRRKERVDIEEDSEVRVGGGKRRGREKGSERWRERKRKHERKRGVGGREGEMSMRLFYDSQGQTFGEVVLFLPEQVFSRRHFFSEVQRILLIDDEDKINKNKTFTKIITNNVDSE